MLPRKGSLHYVRALLYMEQHNCSFMDACAATVSLSQSATGLNAHIIEKPEPITTRRRPSMKKKTIIHSRSCVKSGSDVKGVESFETVTLDDATQTEMFTMYVKTYSSAGQSLWFKQSKDLLYYSYGYMQRSPETQSILWFVLYQPFSNANKISLLVHDGSAIAKQLMFDQLAQLLVTKGYVLEASGAPAHILKSRYRIFPMTDQQDIEFALDASAKGYTIEMNPKFTLTNGEHVYTRRVGAFANNENLFGRICDHKKQQWLRAQFKDGSASANDSSCDRRCMYDDVDDVDEVTNQ